MNLMSILTRRGYFKIIERGIVIESNALLIIDFLLYTICLSPINFSFKNKRHVDRHVDFSRNT